MIDRASCYTKQAHIIQHTEIVYYKDGDEIAREEMFDGHLHATEPAEEMTEEEIEDWT